MKSTLRIIVVCLVALGIAGGLIWGFRSGRTEQAAEADSDAPIEAPSRVTQEAGRTVLTFDEQAQHANGIAAATLTSERRSAETQANGVVLQLQPLLDLKSGYETAQMNIAKARAAAQASQAEYARLRQLNSSEENVAIKSVEMASATAASDAATLTNAEQALAVLKDSMELHWSGTVARWLEQGSPQLDAMLAQREYLIQVTAVGAYSHAVAPEAIAELPDGTHVPARLISALPQIDPRLQAPSLLYAVSAHQGLVAGINLAVYLPAGPVRTGAVVPYGAVVWWQGSAWCYVEPSPNKFTRVEVSTANPAPGGWFVNEGIGAGARVVTEGAQTLLSEEFRTQIQADED
ncbi:MAG: hypothetical protein ACP5E2_16440 [Terracidiphilus sp.]